jgi:hypothetical protein
MIKLRFSPFPALHRKISSSVSGDKDPLDCFSIRRNGSLDLGATEALKRLGWLDSAQPASQMTVNEACTLLVRYALGVGL